MPGAASVLAIEQERAVARLQQRLHSLVDATAARITPRRGYRRIAPALATARRLAAVPSARVPRTAFASTQTAAVSSGRVDPRPGVAECQAPAARNLPNWSDAPDAAAVESVQIPAKEATVFKESDDAADPLAKQGASSDAVAVVDAVCADVHSDVRLHRRQCRSASPKHSPAPHASHEDATWQRHLHALQQRNRIAREFLEQSWTPPADKPDLAWPRHRRDQHVTVPPSPSPARRPGADEASGWSPPLATTVVFRRHPADASTNADGDGYDDVATPKPLKPPRPMPQSARRGGTSPRRHASADVPRQAVHPPYPQSQQQNDLQQQRATDPVSNLLMQEYEWAIDQLRRQARQIKSMHATMADDRPRAAMQRAVDKARDQLTAALDTQAAMASRVAALRREIEATSNAATARDTMLLDVQNGMRDLHDGVARQALDVAHVMDQDKAVRAALLRDLADARAEHERVARNVAVAKLQGEQQAQAAAAAAKRADAQLAQARQDTQLAKQREDAAARRAAAASEEAQRLQLIVRDAAADAARSAAEISRLRDELATAKQEHLLQRQRAEAVAMAAERARLEADDALCKQTRRADAAAERAVGLQQQCEAAEAREEHLRARVAALEAEAAQAQQDARTAAVEVAEAAGVHIETERLRGECASLRKLADQRSLEQHALQQQIEELRQLRERESRDATAALQEARQDKERALTDLMRRLEETETLRDLMLAEAQRTADAMERLQQDNAALRTHVQDLESQLHTQTQQCQVLQARMQALHSGHEESSLRMQRVIDAHI